ncbi:MAG: GFA family protein [Luteimonas sp.]
MQHASGGCLCGDLTVALTLPSKWVAHCHCTQCRRAHGAAFVTWVGMREADVAIGDPRSRLRWHASTPGVAERGFCGRCGSTLFFRSSRWPGELHVTLGNLDTAVDRAPQAHAFWDTHVAWAGVDPHDGLKRMSDPSTPSG